MAEATYKKVEKIAQFWFRSGKNTETPITETPREKTTLEANDG